AHRRLRRRPGGNDGPDPPTARGPSITRRQVGNATHQPCPDQSQPSGRSGSATLANALPAPSSRPIRPTRFLIATAGRAAELVGPVPAFVPENCRRRGGSVILARSRRDLAIAGGADDLAGLEVLAEAVGIALHVQAVPQRGEGSLVVIIKTKWSLTVLRGESSVRGGLC